MVDTSSPVDESDVTVNNEGGSIVNDSQVSPFYLQVNFWSDFVCKMCAQHNLVVGAFSKHHNVTYNMKLFFGCVKCWNC